MPIEISGNGKPGIKETIQLWRDLWETQSHSNKSSGWGIELDDEFSENQMGEPIKAAGIQVDLNL